MLSLNYILIALGVIRAPKWQDHSHNSVPMSSSSQTWYHPPDHPVNALFKRTSDSSPESFAAVGTPQWSAGFPPPFTSPNTSTMPQAWVNALNSAVAAGKIPNTPVSTVVPGSIPVYPNGTDPTNPNVCSGSVKCMIPGDIWNAPDGIYASAFDDGPTQFTPTLVNFLQSNNEKTTHFMIGSNILNNPDQFQTAFGAGHDIAVHTFTHPYMTSKSNLDVVAELGWTAQLIVNSTQGRVPKYWRPPYGDTDVRVSAIAKEVFNLTTVVWNNDPEDWAQTMTSPIQISFKQFLAGPKTPGSIILTHELTNITVGAFMLNYNMIKAYGWNFVSLAQALGGGASYLNAKDSTSNDVTLRPIVSSVPSAPTLPAGAVTSSSRVSSTSSSPASSTSSTRVSSTSSSSVSSSSSSSVSSSSSSTSRSGNV